MSEDMIDEEDFKRFEEYLVARLERGEEQIRNGEVVDGDIVLAEMRKKYKF